MENMGNNVQARRILLRFNGSGTWSKGVASEVEKMQRTLIKAAQTAGLRKPQIMSVQPNSFSVAYSEARMVNSNPSRELKEYGLALNGVTYSTSGGFVSDIAGKLEQYRDRVVSGAVVVPSSPS